MRPVSPCESTGKSNGLANSQADPAGFKQTKATLGGPRFVGQESVSTEHVIGILQTHFEEFGIQSASRKNRWDIVKVIMNYSWNENLEWIPDETLAERLKRLRAFRGFTQEYLAEAAKLPVNTLRQLEQGQRVKPYWPTICALARGLQFPVTAFVGTEGWEPEADSS